MEIKQEPETNSWSQPQLEVHLDVQVIKEDPEETQYPVYESTLDPDEVCSLYKDHQIKDEMVIGPTEFHKMSHEEPSQLVKSSSEAPFVKQNNESNKENQSSSSNNNCSLKYFECREKYSSRKSNQFKKSQKKSLFSCDYCKDIFKTKTHLKKHIKQHKNIQIFKIVCKVCKRKFKDKAQFREHVSLHTGEKSVFKCEVCFKCFTYKNNLARHIKELHNISKIIYSCNNCKANFENRSTYYGHKCSTKIGVKYICDFCKYTFEHKRTLLKHISHHMESPKVYACEMCDKNFSRSYTLKRHLYSHAGKLRTFPCNECDKIFSSSYNLNRHLISHTGKRPYKCSKCDKNFSRLYTLNKHLFSHIGKHLFTCNNCNKSFKSQWGYQNHQKQCLVK